MVSLKATLLLQRFTLIYFDFERNLKNTNTIHSARVCGNVTVKTFIILQKDV